MNRERVERQLRRWERTRTAGMKRFIVVWGVLAWGLTTGLLTSVLIIREEQYGAGEAAAVVLAFLVVTPPVGALWGYAMWFMCEWMYRVQKWRLNRA